MTTRELGGILLTGGSSTRMGLDKATIEFNGATLGQRSADLLSSVVDVAIEVGPGVTSLEAVQEKPAGSGPLAAVVAGHAALLERGLSRDASCIVLACDLPLLTKAILDALSTRPRDNSMLPVIEGAAQPLCARWSASDLETAARELHVGKRSLRGLPDPSKATILDDAFFGERRREMADADTPADLETMRAAADIE